MTAASVLMLGASTDDADYALSANAALLVTAHGNGFVLDMADRFYAIPAVAAVMLRRTLEAGEAAAIADIAARYDIDTATARADLKRFLDDLHSRGVLLRRGDVEKPVTVSRGARLLAKMARVALALPSTTSRAAAMLTLSRVSFAAFGWNATLQAWKDAVPKAAAAADAQSDSGSIDQAVRSVSAKLPFGTACKERALSAWAMARAQGLRCSLVVGIMQHPLAAHTWCETESSAILGDEVANCERFRPVFRYA